MTPALRPSPSFGGPSSSPLIATASASAQTAPSGAQGTIVAIQGRVEHTPARQDAWTPAALQQPLFALERVRTQSASRAAILFVDETQVRLNAGAVLTVQEVKRGTGNPTLLDLTQGEGWFRTKNPASGLTVKTPAASAAIRGTEINVSVGTDEETVLTVVEGAAEFFNEFGRVTATAGEQATARPGQAPVKRVVLNPEDAVQWALYYPAASRWDEWPAAALTGPGRTGFGHLLAGDATAALAQLQPAAVSDPWSAIGVAGALTQPRPPRRGACRARRHPGRARAPARSTSSGAHSPPRRPWRLVTSRRPGASWTRASRSPPAPCGRSSSRRPSR